MRLSRLPFLFAPVVLALLLAAGSAGAPAASASSSTYLVTRSGTTYRAVSQTTAFSGTLKSVVESAVRSLGETGGTVAFSSGDFDLGTDFFLLHRVRNITFAGQGMDATVIRNSSDAAADTEPFNFQDTDNVVIRDLTVSAGGALRSTSDAIDFDRGNNSSVERVKITGSRAKGIIFDGKNAGWSAEGNTVRDCVVTGVPSNGIELLAASNNLVEGCTISDVGRDGIAIGKSSTTADQSNKKSNNNTIRRNRIDNAGLNGIYVKSGDGNRILGNTITNSSYGGGSNDGIRITSADSITCDGNIVDGNTATDSQAVKTQRYGLRIASPLCHDTTVGVNELSGNRLGPVLDQGTGTRTGGATGPRTFLPSADAYVSADAPGRNYGTGATLRVDGSPTLRSYLRFDVSGLTGAVSRATLRVYANSSQSTGIDVHLAGGGWTETGIIHATAPAPGARLGSSGRAAAGTWLAVDVTPAVTGNGTYTFALATTGSTALSLASRESATPPELVVETGRGGTATLSLLPGADAYVSADVPGRNYGTGATLRVDGSPTLRSSLRFDVSGLAGTVTRATLRVYANSSQSTGIDAHAAAGNWTETGVTHATAPAPGARLGSSGRAAAGTWLTVDVTPAVTGNGTYTFVLATTGSTALSLASRESANPPELTIETAAAG